MNKHAITQILFKVNKERIIDNNTISLASFMLKNYVDLFFKNSILRRGTYVSELKLLNMANE